jgi:hypothetical protein
MHIKSLASNVKSLRLGQSQLLWFWQHLRIGGAGFTPRLSTQRDAAKRLGKFEIKKDAPESPQAR